MINLYDKMQLWLDLLFAGIIRQRSEFTSQRITSNISLVTSFLRLLIQPINLFKSRVFLVSTRILIRNILSSLLMLDLKINHFTDLEF